MIVISLLSCGEANFYSGDTSDTSIPSVIIPDWTIPSVVTTTNAKNDTVPPRYSFYNFNSYDEFLSQFDEEANIKDSLFLSELSMTSKLNQKLFAYLSELENINLPKSNGNVMDLNRITYFTDDLYSLPWIWYHCMYNNQHIRVSLTYPSIRVNTDDFYTLEASEILKLIHPTAANVHNYQDFPTHKNVYPVEIELYNEKVSALIFEYTDDERISIMFYHNNAWILLKAEKEVLTEDFLKSFSLG